MAMKASLAVRVARVHRVLVGTGKLHGQQSWFARQVERITGWKPGPSTVYRWFKQEVATPDERAERTLIRLERAALKKLQYQQEWFSHVLHG